MPINGSDLINQPFNTLTGPYTDILGMGFFLVVFVFIIAAVYIKTRNAVSALAVMLVVGMLFTGGGIFADFPQMSLVFLALSLIALVGLIVNTVFMLKQ